MLILYKILILKLFLQAGIGTVFSSVDKYNPNPHLACAVSKVLKDSDLVVAHRELPCNAKVVVCNQRTQLCVNAVVKDRGPFGVLGSHYTSIIDLSPRVAKAIQHNGFEEVIVGAATLIPNKPPKKKPYIRKNS